MIANNQNIIYNNNIKRGNEVNELNSLYKDLLRREKREANGGKL